MREEILQAIQQLAPMGTPLAQVYKYRESLADLTSRLIASYEADGLLRHDPFETTRSRALPLLDAELRERLAASTVLVTGGAGFVGTRLLLELAEIGARRLVSLDLKPLTQKAPHQAIHHLADVRDTLVLDELFSREKPDIVFHLAAQRLPAQAEVDVFNTVSTNIFGTRNILRLCLAFDVKCCVYASSGKAARFYTENIYAGTKRLAEFLFVESAQIPCRLIRFTHIVENSAFLDSVHRGIKDGLVRLFTPGRVLVAQSVSEAVRLLVNSLAWEGQSNPAILALRDIGWPLDLTEIALFHIKKGRLPGAIYFSGIPQGYDGHEFQGQIDWSDPANVVPMINLLERVIERDFSNTGIVVANPAPASSQNVRASLEALEASLGDPADEESIRDHLLLPLQALASTQFRHAGTTTMLKALKWGCDQDQLRAQGDDLANHRDVVSLIFENLSDCPDLGMLQESGWTTREWAALQDQVVRWGLTKQ